MRKIVNLSFAFLGLCLLTVGLQSCGGDREAMNTSREVIEAILRGDKPETDDFQWESLNIEGDDIGKTYSQMTREFEKKEYRNYSLSKIATMFKMNGWTVDKIENWRIHQSTKHATTVAFDVPGATIEVLMVLKDGRKRIVGIKRKV